MKILFDMPGGKTHFTKDWRLHACQEVGKGVLVCLQENIPVQRSRAPQLLQLARGQSHRILANEILDGSQMIFASIILRSSIVMKPDFRSEDWAPRAIRILAKELKVSVDLDNLST